MTKVQILEQKLELENLRRREHELEMLKEDAEKNFIKLVLMLRECRERRQKLE